jgi:hypothetical protein
MDRLKKKRLELTCDFCDVADSKSRSDGCALEPWWKMETDIQSQWMMRCQLAIDLGNQMKIRFCSERWAELLYQQYLESQSEQGWIKGEKVSHGGQGWTNVEGDLFWLLGYNCRRLKLEKVSKDSFRATRANSGSLSARAARNDRELKRITIYKLKESLGYFN